MFFYQLVELHAVMLFRKIADIYHLLVKPQIKIMIFVKNVGYSAAHSGRKILSGFAENHRSAAGHIFAAVIAAALDHRNGTGIPYAKALAGNAVYKGLAAGRTVKGNVADYYVFLRRKAAFFVRLYYKLAARKSLTEVVVAVAGQLNGQSLGDKRAEGLSARTRAVYRIGIVIEGIAEALCDLGAENGAEGSVNARNLN